MARKLPYQVSSSRLGSDSFSATTTDEFPSSKDVVVLPACVAPFVLDASHSLNTLRYCEAFRPVANAAVITNNPNVIGDKRSALAAVNGTIANRMAVSDTGKEAFSW